MCWLFSSTFLFGFKANNGQYGQTVTERTNVKEGGTVNEMEGQKGQKNNNWPCDAFYLKGEFPVEKSSA